MTFKTIAQGVKFEDPSFISNAINKVINILGLNTEEWDSIHHLYSYILSNNQLEESVTFNDLDADCSSLLQLTVELEHCLGDEMPVDWQDLKIIELDTIYQQKRL